MTESNYKKACDSVLINRAANSKSVVKVQFENGKSLPFILKLLKGNKRND